MKFQGKLMNQTRENCKRPYFGLDFGWPKCGPANFVPQVLSLLVVRNCFKLSSYAIYSNANEPNLRKRAKNNNFGSNCSPFGTNQDPKRLLGLFTSTSIKGLYQVIVLCNLKKTKCTKCEKIAINLISGPVLDRLAKFGPPVFFVGFTSNRCYILVQA